MSHCFSAACATSAMGCLCGCEPCTTQTRDARASAKACADEVNTAREQRLSQELAEETVNVVTSEPTAEEWKRRALAGEALAHNRGLEQRAYRKRIVMQRDELRRLGKARADKAALESALTAVRAEVARVEEQAEVAKAVYVNECNRSDAAEARGAAKERAEILAFARRCAERDARMFAFMAGVIERGEHEAKGGGNG